MVNECRHESLVSNKRLKTVGNPSKYGEANGRYVRLLTRLVSRRSTIVVVYIVGTIPGLMMKGNTSIIPAVETRTTSEWLMHLGLGTGTTRQVSISAYRCEASTRCEIMIRDRLKVITTMTMIREVVVIRMAGGMEGRSMGS